VELCLELSLDYLVDTWALAKQKNGLRIVLVNHTLAKLFPKILGS
jgi:hypothetical protein